MNIGIDLTSLKPDRISGIEVYALNISCALMKLGAPGIAWHLYFSRSGGRLIGSWFPGQRSFVSSSDNRIFNEQVWLPAQYRGHKLDLMYYPGYPPSPLLSARSVMTLHDTTLWDYPMFSSLGGKLYYKLLFESGIPRTRRLITVSETSKRSIAKRFHIDDIEVIPNALDARFFSSDASRAGRATAAAGLNLPEKYILFVGTIEPRKNLDNLISAFLDAVCGQPDCSLVLAGRIAWGKEVVEKYKSMSRILFTGYLDQQSIEACYRNAEFVILPSVYEGFGLPVLEAFYFHKLVCCSGIDAFREVAGDAAVYFDPADVRSISEAIRHCIRLNGEGREALAAQGRQRLEKFSWNRSARLLLNCLKDALTGTTVKIAV